MTRPGGRTVALRQLDARGWTRRNAASGARLEEIVEAYRTLGFEILLVPVRDLPDPGCTACMEDEGDEPRTWVVYTRPAGADPAGPPGRGDEGQRHEP